jgi:hypothetical protein
MSNVSPSKKPKSSYGHKGGNRYDKHNFLANQNMIIPSGLYGTQNPYQTELSNSQGRM